MYVTVYVTHATQMVQLVAALCFHLPATIYQTPNVFGVRIVMVPAYALVACKSFNLALKTRSRPRLPVLAERVDWLWRLCQHTHTPL